MRLRIRKPWRRGSGRYAPTSGRQRLLIVGLAVAVTLVIGVAMLAPHVAFLRGQKALQRQDRPACAEGQTEGCVGGRMPVLVLPAAASQAR